VTGLDIAHAERNGWQRRAAAALVRLLDEHRELPVIAWTVGPAGSVLVGRVNGLQPTATARAVFDAWTNALTPSEVREHAHLALTYLSAQARRDSVTIVLQADLILDDEDGGRP
jgi:hypothetical protein